jgi:hypothetical protein
MNTRTPTYWLYADPDDEPSVNIIKIVKIQFPQAILCEDFDQLQSNINDDQQHVVLIIEPTDCNNPLYSNSNEVNQKKEWSQKIKKLVSNPIQCIWFVPEIFSIRFFLDWVSVYPNLLIVCPGQQNFGNQHYPWVIWQYWLYDAVKVYKTPTMQTYINKFDPTTVKPMLFDALLGGNRIYRTLLHDWIEQDESISQQTIMAYCGGNTTRPSEILEPDMIVPGPITHFGIPCKFHDIVTRTGLIPPISVYQQTAYSIVTETNAQDNQVFFTEKIARVMVSRRLFIVLSSYRYLHYLRESGFKTFGHIINESYDLEVDDVRRWRMAFEQMQALAAMDQQKVLEQIQPIVEHNLQVLMNTDWNQQMATSVNQILNARLNFKKS